MGIAEIPGLGGPGDAQRQYQAEAHVEQLEDVQVLEMFEDWRECLIESALDTVAEMSTDYHHARLAPRLRAMPEHTLLSVCRELMGTVRAINTVGVGPRGVFVATDYTNWMDQQRERAIDKLLTEPRAAA